MCSEIVTKALCRVTEGRKEQKKGLTADPKRAHEVRKMTAVIKRPQWDLWRNPAIEGKPQQNAPSGSTEGDGRSGSPVIRAQACVPRPVLAVRLLDQRVCVPPLLLSADTLLQLLLRGRRMREVRGMRGTERGMRGRERGVRGMRERGERGERDERRRAREG